MHKAIFLDRDGVINEVLSKRVKFVNQPEDLYLLGGVREAILSFNKTGWKVFIVTNQGGIGLGYMSETELSDIHKKLRSDLLEVEAKIDDIAYCPHQPNAGCPCRKPKPQMILDLAERYNINLEESYMVGDRKTDIEAGQAAGVKTVLIGERIEEDTATADMKFMTLYEFAVSLQS